MKNRWLSAAIFLIILGIVFYLVNLASFVPRFLAFRDATLAWNQANNSTAMPNPADFGWDYSSSIVSAFLSSASGVLLLIGGAYLLIQLMARIIRQLGYIKAN